MPRHPIFVLLPLLVIIGGGLHWQTHRSSDLELDIRYHFNFSRVDADQINRFWTVGLNFGFGI